MFEKGRTYAVTMNEMEPPEGMVTRTYMNLTVAEVECQWFVFAKSWAMR